mmetsp:Transcript_115030/g.371741  ORF Transcript_115030/g.371741 Transcript_115030/m.371741 type:complete len:261 (+) Transcript_115030:361-1143(+)
MVNNVLNVDLVGIGVATRPSSSTMSRGVLPLAVRNAPTASATTQPNDQPMTMLSLRGSAIIRGITRSAASCVRERKPNVNAPVTGPRECSSPGQKRASVRQASLVLPMSSPPPKMAYIAGPPDLKVLESWVKALSGPAAFVGSSPGSKAPSGRRRLPLRASTRSRVHRASGLVRAMMADRLRFCNGQDREVLAYRNTGGPSSTTFSSAGGVLPATPETLSTLSKSFGVVKGMGRKVRSTPPYSSWPLGRAANALTLMRRP